MFKEDKKGKEEARVDGDLDKRRTKRTPQKYFWCGSEDHVIVKCLNHLKILRNN